MFLYFCNFFVLLRLVNVYVVWFLIEIIFLLFLLYILTKENKSVGLVIYFFFQRVISLFLFVFVFLFLSKIIFLILCAKLGLFPFFYWIVVVRLKVDYIGNIFVLVFQKIPVFWFLWLVYDSFLLLLILLAYSRIIFVLLNLLLVSDLWLLLVYSSIANTGIIMLSIYGHSYIIVVFIYLFILLRIIFIVKFFDSYFDLILVVLIFLVIPPFILFFIKIFMVYRLMFSLKLIFFLFFLDVFILFYYFTLLFIKFFIIERRVLIYFINLIIIVIVLFFRNCVALIVFYKS